MVPGTISKDETGPGSRGPRHLPGRELPDGPHLGDKRYPALARCVDGRREARLAALAAHGGKILFVTRRTGGLPPALCPDRGLADDLASTGVKKCRKSESFMGWRTPSRPPWWSGSTVRTCQM